MQSRDSTFGWDGETRELDEFQSNRWSEQECRDEFQALFPFGFAGDDVVAEIAPPAAFGGDASRDGTGACSGS
jgi:hypothetical protein